MMHYLGIESSRDGVPLVPRRRMPSLSETLAKLAATRAAPARSGDRLGDIADFGSDPGNLRARCHVPDALPAGAPLVVVLHGCAQDAAGYDIGSGWSTLADRNGFALLYPEQRQANNANRCFNWFAAGDIARDAGEAGSIRQMVASMIAAHAIDPGRVYVTGLSAGGAMALVMLATYPEVFAGGAIIAGLPYGTAHSVGDALQRMRGSGLPSAPALADLVRAAAPAPPHWPTLSVWHGTADTTVAPANMEAIVGTWTALHDIPFASAESDRVDGQQRRRWIGLGGVVAVEAYRIAGLGHGTPIDPSGPDAVGVAMPFMLACGIDSTSRIAAFWGIADVAAAAAEPVEAIAAPRRPVAPAGVGKVIEDALRAAGLMR